MILEDMQKRVKGHILWHSTISSLFEHSVYVVIKSNKMDTHTKT